ncbi:hypothetical protein DDZ14_04630 [Maritimibacter sp. 55A14]|uniref:DUF883 family protein n=1 Tax=Maritimibacter sp. 55A14 TaxID=2174844 RepID=UPI000D605DF4|nr:DUF883 family protein [Maritimibacter sp. 55A14]PWE33488.1 hypothetical protein DDZ14_04630 [Maritimibacter sp. 55A14]
MAQKDTAAQADTEQLSKQIEMLKNDIASISQTLTDMGAQRRDEAVEGMRRTASELRDRGQARAAEAREYAEDTGHQVADAVRQQPATAVGLAVGLGFILGFLTSRR